MLEVISNGIVWVINFILSLIGTVLSLIVSVLPNSPFEGIVSFANSSGISEYLGYLAWLIPIGYIFDVTALWVTCVSLYYLYSLVMRWIKMIE